MRALEARRIPISDYLEREGVKPESVRKGGRELWYASPIRGGENTASFKVDTIKNLWFDHGAGKGGNVIDLVCELRRVTVAEALAILAGLHGVAGAQTLPIGATVAGEKKNEAAFKVVDVRDVAHPALLQYLGSRGIPLALGRQHLKEVHFQPGNGTGRYFALGFPCGTGWDVRSAVFKGFVGSTKDVTFIDAGEGNVLSVFEGFMDYLSLLAHLKVDALAGSVLILHSTAQTARAVARVSGRRFTSIDLYLDRDASGRSATAAFEQATAATQCPVIDQSTLYAPFSDLNAWRIKQGDQRHDDGPR